MQFKYHFGNPNRRGEFDLRPFEKNICETIKLFPMIKFIGITELDFTIELMITDWEKKEGIIKAFIHKLAMDTSLRMFVNSRFDEWNLFVEKR